MREIKFRAWDTKFKRLIADFLNFAGWEAHSGYNVWKMDRYISEQFTGLHDKNGKEIYEGDIVDWIVLGRKDTQQVKYKTELASFIMCNLIDNGGSWSIADRTNFIEVIGNIHENPELLENN